MKKIVLSSTSKRECLLKLGLSPYGGNYRVLDKYINLFDIDTSHFLGQGWNVNNSPADIKPIEKYFNNEIPITSYKFKNLPFFNRKLQKSQIRCRDLTGNA